MKLKIIQELRDRLYAAEKNDTIVLYVTTLEAVRATRDKCSRILKIFEILGLKVQVKDVHLDPRYRHTAVASYLDGCWAL